MSSPSVGQWVQRIDDGRIGRVAVIAVAGERNHTGNPFMLAGDVEVALGTGSSIVTRLTGFWAKWRPLDLEGLARRTVEIALGDAGCHR